jgi:hypothetical protein
LSYIQNKTTITIPRFDSTFVTASVSNNSSRYTMNTSAVAMNAIHDIEIEWMHTIRMQAIFYGSLGALYLVVCFLGLLYIIVIMLRQTPENLQRNARDLAPKGAEVYDNNGEAVSTEPSLFSY